MIDIVDRMRFDATRCEAVFSKGVTKNIEEGIAEIKRLRKGLEKIQNTYVHNINCTASELAYIAADTLRPHS